MDQNTNRNTPTNTENNGTQDAQQAQATKMLMQSYLGFLRNTANKNQDEVEQKLREVLDIFNHLSAKDLFGNNEEVSESEKYFVNEFAPELLKILLSENSKSPNVRELIQDLLNIYAKEFQKALQNLSLENTEFKFNLWEKVVSIFNSEDNLFYRSAPDNKDATDSFLDSIYEKLNPDFAQWREALKPGDLVDYLYKDSAMSFSGYKGIGVCNWTRAEVLSIDANKVAQLRLIGTDDIVNTSLTSFFILPFKTLSLDFEWREQIQIGDEIDFLDNRSWYRSTVLELNESISLRGLLKKSEGEKAEPVKRKLIKYALRIYRPDARITDSKGNKFYGWGETYDKETSVHDPRIRKANSFSKIIYNYDIINYYPLDSRRFTELESIVPCEVGELKFYIIPRKFDNKNISNFYYDLLHNFGIEQNGFGIIIKILQLINSLETPNNASNKASEINNDNNTKTETENTINSNSSTDYLSSPNTNTNKLNNNLSVQLIEQLFPAFSVIISFFNHTNQFLHIQFASEYLKEMIQLSLSILKKFSLIETRNFKREKLELLFKQLKEIMYRVYIDSDVNAILDLFGIEFGINCLKHSIILDKKLLGFKVLNDTLTEVAKNCSNSSSFTDRHLPAGQLVERLMQQNIFELIFGPSSHSQILQKSGELLKSLLMTKALKPKDFQRLFDICEDATDAETKGFILKGLTANAIQLNVDGSYFIIKHIISKKTQYLQTGLSRFKITNDDIDLLISAFKALPLAAVKEISKRVGEFLFDIIFYEEEGIENLNNNNSNANNANNNSNFASNNPSTSNSPNNQFLDNSSANSTNLINTNNPIGNTVSILSGLKYEKIVEDFVVLMKAIEFRDYSNKVFEDILIILKNRKLESSDAVSNKDFIGIVKILRLLMGSYLNILDDSTRSRLLILIYDEYAILDLLMEFITQYHKEVLEILEKESSEADSSLNAKGNEHNNDNKNKNVKKKIGDRTFKVFRNNTHKHSDVMMEIINFINYMMTSQKMINLSKDQILTLYRIYVEEPINKQDVNVFFKMLKEADSKKAIAQEVFQNIFEMMIQSKKLEFSDISLDLFNCVWNFFLIINKNKGNLIMNDGGSKTEGYSSVGPSGQQLYSFSYTNNQGSKSEEIRCVVDPKELIGFDLIWRLVLSSANESQVAKEAINNIVKIFFNVKIENKIEDNTNKITDHHPKENLQQKGYSWGLLIEKCIETIKSITNKASSNPNSSIHTVMNNKLNEAPDQNQNPNENLKTTLPSKDSSLLIKSPKASENQTRLINCLTILRVLIEETEKKGTAGCISHNSLLKSSILTLKIENSIFNSSHQNRFIGTSGAAYSNTSNNQNQKDEKNFTLKVYANTTRWDLKKLIASKINTLPEGIRINTNNSKDITENDHGKTLAELAIKDQDKLTVVISSVFQNIPKTVLTKNGKFTEKAEKTLKEIFSIFADENNLMDQESAARFATIATDSLEPLLVDDSRVKHLFETYDFDKDGFVSLEGFLKFFHDSIEVNRKVDTVWDNIRAFGYRNDLKKYNESLDEYNTNLHIMPRFVISKNQDYFNAIFALQDEEEKIAKEASKFLSIICTNPVIYRDILLLKELGFEDKNHLDENENKTNAEIWLKYIDVNNRFKLLYVLQIIESYFEEFEFAAVDIDSEPIESVILEESVKADLHPQHKIWWIEKFLSKGGLELIIQKLYLNIDFNEIVSSHYLWKKILNLSTKIIKNCFSFLFRASNLNKTEVVQFIRKESFGALDDSALKEKISSLEESVSNINNNKSEEKEINNVHEIFNKKENSENSELQKQLSRKLSKDIENLKNDEELIKLIHNKYGDSIINRINFEQISYKLITFSYIISLKKETEVEERNFFNNSINLLSLIIISQENIKLFLHNLFTINEDIKDYIAKNEKVFNTNIINVNSPKASDNYSFLPPANILTFENFILTGILRNTSIIIRMNFQKCLSNLCESLQKMHEYSLNVFLLNLFKNLLTKISAEEKTSSRYFFILFTNLLELNTHISQEDEERLCFDLLSVVFENPNTLPEEMLNGYLKILILILKKRKDLIHSIMQRFDIVNKIIDTFILKDVQKIKDLFAVEAKINEAQAKLEYLEIEELKSLFDEKAYCSFSAEAKNAIFNLLLILLKDNFGNTKKFFNGKFASITNFLSDLKKDKKMYNPSMEKRKKDSFIGLRNLHSICYMNSVLQQFFNVPSFRYALLQADDNKVLNLTEQNKEVDDNILHQLQRMFVYLEYSNRSEFNPSQFCYSFKDFDGNPTNVNIQNDSQEFLASLFDKLELSLKNTEFKYLLNSIFMGKTCSQLICKGGCGKIRNNFEDLYSLSLEVQGKKTLKDSLEKYISEERIEDFFCSNCQKKVNVIKRTSFAELPNILIVHLQRIIFNYETFMNEKINSRLEFPKKLNLKAYSTEVINNVEQEESNNNSDFNLSNGVSESIDNEKEEENSEKKINDTRNNNNNNSDNDNNPEQKEDESAKEFRERVFHKNQDYYEYELVGVIVHLGIANAGHYYSYINIQRDGADNKMNFNPSDDSHVRKWMTFNDSSVLNFNVDQMETECFGGSANGKNDTEDLIGWNKKNDWDNSKNAYMLVYERVKKTPITLVIPESQLTEEQENNDNNKNNNNKSENPENLNLHLTNKKKNFTKILSQKKQNDELIPVNKANYYKIQKQIHNILTSSSSAKVPLDCDDTAVSRRNVSSESIYNLVFHNEDKNEYFYYTPFYMFGKAEKRLLPAAHMHEVLLDNLLFSNDQNIFCNEFSEFLDKAVIDLYESYEKDEHKNEQENEKVYKQIFEILLGYALNILSKASSRDALGKLVNNLNKFLESFPEFSKLCLENLVDNKELVTEILFSSEENANLAYKNLIVNAMVNYVKHYSKEILDYQNKKAAHEDKNLVNKSSDKNNDLEISDFLIPNKPLVYKLLDNLIDLMPTEVSKIWNRMLAYLELFESLASSGLELIVDYLFEKELVSRLIDLALGKESPLYRKGESRNEIGNKVAPPKFTPLLNTISNLVRRSYTESFTSEAYLASGKKHFPNTLILFPENPDKIYTLSHSDLECLYQRAFYKKCIKDGYNNCALSKLLAHLMFDNFELSKKRVYMLMEAVNEGNSLQDAKAACELLFNVLNLSDKYSTIRLEWVFGIPQMQMKLIDTPFPAIINNKKSNSKENKFGGSNEKIYKFVSSILYGTTLDSLIDRLIYKYQTSVDFITILVYFFSIVFKNKDTLIYFDALPHPKDEKLRLKDYIFQLANEELNRIYNITNSESKFEKSIKSIVFYMENYESKKQEFIQASSEGGKEGVEKYKFQPAYSLGEIAKEIIKHREDDVINKHNVFCFEVEYENAVESFSENALQEETDKEPVSGWGAQETDAKGNLNDYIEDEGATKADVTTTTTATIDNNNNKDIVIESVQENQNENSNETEKEEANKEEEKIASSNESNKNNSNNSNVAVYGDADDRNFKVRARVVKDVSRFDDNNSKINNKNNCSSNDNNLIDLKSTNDIKVEGNNYSQNYTANKAIEDFAKNNEESFFKRNLEKLITSQDAFVRSNPTSRQQPKDALQYQNCIKRIILFNNSDNDYKVRFSFYTGDDFENFYLPKSDIIVIAKKNSVVNVQTFVKHDYLLPWNEFNYMIDCELYESSSSNDNRFESSNVNFKRPKSQSDMKGDTNIEAPLALPAPGDSKNEVEYGPQVDGPNNAAEDSLPIECMKCFHMNYFNSSTNTFICKGCNKDLFS